MWSITSLIAFSLVWGAFPSAAQSTPDLIDALKAAGATKFAETIKSNPELLNLYTSSAVGTVFAPADSASPPAVNITAKLRKRQSGTNYGAYGMGAAQGIQTGAKFNQQPSGLVIPVSNPQAGGQPNNVVSNPAPANGTSAKRWAYERDNGATSPGLTISGGLGTVVNVLKTDIPYSGGLIHLSSGLKTFSSLIANSTNFTTGLDTNPLTTVFLPSDAAFAAANISASTSVSPNFLPGHVVPNFLGYLPNLQNGAKLKTQTGDVLTVTFSGGSYYINGAKIITANIILPNGVAHIVNKVIQPAPPTVPSGANILSMGWAANVACVVAGASLLSLA
ncbi:FAS1 domain-containing protein [Thozetella sp. PMI_491]|nr:FAS1 domain-containing protein [Thozetella sp. PMI_491]